MVESADEVTPARIPAVRAMCRATRRQRLRDESHRLSCPRGSARRCGRGWVRVGRSSSACARADVLTADVDQRRSDRVQQQQVEVVLRRPRDGAVNSRSSRAAASTSSTSRSIWTCVSRSRVRSRRSASAASPAICTSRTAAPRAPARTRTCRLVGTGSSLDHSRGVHSGHAKPAARPNSITPFATSARTASRTTVRETPTARQLSL